MANRALVTFQSEEYARLKGKLFREWSIDLSKTPRIEALAKGLYRYYLSLSCCSVVVGGRLKHNEYVGGIPEAAYVGIVVALRGLENPSSVLLRQCIELRCGSFGFRAMS